MIRGSFLARRANATRLLLVTIMLTVLVTATHDAGIVDLADEVLTLEDGKMVT